MHQNRGINMNTEPMNSWDIALFNWALSNAAEIGCIKTIKRLLDFVEIGKDIDLELALEVATRCKQTKAIDYLKQVTRQFEGTVTA